MHVEIFSFFICDQSGKHKFFHWWPFSFLPVAVQNINSLNEAFHDNIMETYLRAAYRSLLSAIPRVHEYCGSA